MLSVPLPFLAGLVFALTLYRSLKGVDAPGSRRYFFAFLILYALQGVIVGLHFGYGIKALAPVQPITAAIMPPLAFLAFRALMDERLGQSWLHILPPLAVAAAVGFLRVLVDPLLLVIFFGYGIALWRLTLLGGADAMAEASLPQMRPALRAARLTAGLMLFFAVSDAALSAYTDIYGPGDVPLAVAIMNLAVIAAVIAYYFSPDFSSAKPTAASPSLEPTEEDKATLSRIEAALEDGELYRSEDLSLAKLSRKARLPAREASAVINRATGLNVSQFVNDRRIAEACRLLRETERTVIQVMLDVGFSTKSNFNREFRRVTGMSPKQWRAGARAAQDGGAIKTRP
ncbi:AraC family transcriptional regulator [Neorhizobium galegae]|uniref:helix-turn-helix domain-containing protein n=1 Tax=Neorhizobium galegae TaxID=399 RepID=UPI002101B25F|nr:AraC family transcriptional regulator [Neorhizobium galegae]